MHSRTGSRLRKNFVIYTLTRAPAGVYRPDYLAGQTQSSVSGKARRVRVQGYYANRKRPWGGGWRRRRRRRRSEPAKRIGCNFARWHRAMHELDQLDLSINCGLYKTGKKGEREREGIVPFSLPRYILHEHVVSNGARWWENGGTDDIFALRVPWQSGMERRRTHWTFTSSHCSLSSPFLRATARRRFLSSP